MAVRLQGAAPTRAGIVPTMRPMCAPDAAGVADAHALASMRTPSSAAAPAHLPPCRLPDGAIARPP